MLDRLFTPLLPTLGLNSNAAEVVSILLIHTSSQEYLISNSSLLFDWTDSWTRVYSSLLVLCFSSHLASFVGSTGDWWRKMNHLIGMIHSRLVFVPIIFWNYWYNFKKCKDFCFEPPLPQPWNTTSIFFFWPFSPVLFDHSFGFGLVLSTLKNVTPQHMEKCPKIFSHCLSPQNLIFSRCSLMAVSSKVFQNCFCTWLQASGILLELPPNSIKDHCWKQCLKLPQYLSNLALFLKDLLRFIRRDFVFVAFSEFTPDQFTVFLPE